jgi:hypothetical protein
LVLSGLEQVLKTHKYLVARVISARIKRFWAYALLRNMPRVSSARKSCSF